MFEPTDGICFRCHNDIYKQNPYTQTAGYNPNDKSKGWHTSCPHCHVSFVD
nr:MAG TPA: NapC/NirT cytochrome c family, N-terminal region [Caudoviricetes sp.]